MLRWQTVTCRYCSNSLVTEYRRSTAEEVLGYVVASLRLVWRYIKHLWLPHLWLGPGGAFLDPLTTQQRILDSIAGEIESLLSLVPQHSVTMLRYSTCSGNAFADVRPRPLRAASVPTPHHSHQQHRAMHLACRAAEVASRPAEV